MAEETTAAKVNKMSKNTDEENKDLCKDCTTCCEYVTIELDEPEKKIDFEEIIWFLMHENIIVYIDEENTWNVEFKTKCKALDEHGLCRIYEERPDICKEYHQDECEKYGHSDYCKVLFKTKDDVINYVKNNPKFKGIY
jgi:Fe-S-cluster containining protein